MNPIIGGLALLLWGLPVLHGALPTTLTAHNFERVAQLFLLLGVSVWWAWRTGALQEMPGRPSARRPPWRWVLTALILASTLQAAYPTIALRELLIFAGLFSLGQVVAATVTDPAALRNLFRLLAGGALTYAALVLLMVAASLLAGSFNDPWAVLIGFDNPRFLNHVQTIALPLVAVVAAQDEAPFWRRLAWLALLLSGMLLFMTYGRATLLALLLGLLTALWAFGRRAWPYARQAAVPTLAGMALMGVVYWQWMQPSGFSIDPKELVHPHYRGFLIGQAVKLWQTSPWLGVGPMHFAHWYNAEAAHPHDIYFQILAEYGAPAALIILLGVGRWLFGTLRALRAAPDPHVHMAIGLWGALLGIAVDGALSGNFVMPLSQLWIALAVGLAGAFRRAVLVDGASRGAADTASASSRGWRRLRWWLPAALLWLAVQSAWVYASMTEPVMPTPGAVNAHPGMHTANPRFWSFGWF